MATLERRLEVLEAKRMARTMASRMTDAELAAVVSPEFASREVTDDELLAYLARAATLRRAAHANA